MGTIEQTWQRCGDLIPYAWGYAYDAWIAAGRPDVMMGDWVNTFWGGY